MFDIHNHLIYEFDDGPKSLQEAVDMVKEAESQGITHAFATSHFQEIIPTTMEDDYFRKLEELRNRLEAENVQVQIHSGSELFYHHFMNETVKQHRVCRLIGTSKYVLFEQLNPTKILNNTEVESPPIPEFKNGGLFSRLRKMFTF